MHDPLITSVVARDKNRSYRDRRDPAYMPTPRRKKAPTRELKRLAAMLREVKADTGMSDRAIAAQLRITQAYATMIMNEGRAGIGAEIIRAAAKAFGVDVRYFFDDYEGLVSYKKYKESTETRAIAALQARLERLENASRKEPDPAFSTHIRKAGRDHK